MSAQQSAASVGEPDAVPALRPPRPILMISTADCRALLSHSPQEHGFSVTETCSGRNAVRLVDGFKIINDMLGHSIGDAVLKCVADRLRDHLRDSDRLARLGGDEFAVIQVADSAAALASRGPGILVQPADTGRRGEALLGELLSARTMGAKPEAARAHRVGRVNRVLTICPANAGNLTAAQLTAP